MIRINYKEFLLKDGRSLMEITLIFPGIVTFFPVITGLIFTLLHSKNEEQILPSVLPLSEISFIAILCFLAGVLRWKLFSTSRLLAPMKPNQKPFLRSASDEFPENPNEVKALLALERFKTATIAVRAVLALASFILTLMVSWNPHWIFLASGIFLILIYAKLFAPQISLLDAAIEELTYTNIKDSIDMDDFLSSHSPDIERFINPDSPEQGMPDSAEPLTEDLKQFQKSGDLAGLARFAWLNLSGSASQCDDFDYFPDGGMRNFYCHLLNYCSYSLLAKAAGMPVFLSGPHSAEKLNLNSESDFGHYNPAFVQKLTQWTLPALDDEAFRRLTQPVYDRFVRPLARTQYAVYKKWTSRPDLLEKEKNAYEKRLAEKITPACDYEKFYGFLNINFPAGEDSEDHEEYDGNVVKTAAAFWLRRFMDGTAEDFFKGLRMLLETYDKNFINADGRIF